MEISKDILVRLVSQAFDSGNQGSYELKNQEIEEIILTIGCTQDGEWEVASIAKLKQQLHGKKIYHDVFGYGIITHKAAGEQYVQFGGFRMELNEGWPWTAPIQFVS